MKGEVHRKHPSLAIPVARRVLSDSPLASTSLALAFLLADLVLTLGYLALTLGYPLMVPISVGHITPRLCGFAALRLCGFYI